jgi:phosphoglycolate phosphatase-like HAD superfamily hydrolase
MTTRYLVLFDVDGVLVEQGELRRPPGAAEALAQLRHDGDAVLSVVTGQPEDEARHRTDVVGVNRYLDLDVGAYGSDTEDRSTLVSLARRRAQEAYGGEFTVLAVTGESAADVAHLRPHADVVVALVGKKAETAGLLAAGADHAVTSLLGVVELARGVPAG